MKNLTPKEEKFCLAIASGKMVRDAYRESYNAADSNDKVAINEGRRLLDKPHIRERIEELRKPLQNSALNDVSAARVQQELFILDRIRVCKEKEDEQSIIRYTDMLNKIYGIYKDIPGDQVENKLETVNDDLLKKLAQAV